MPFQTLKRNGNPSTNLKFLNLSNNGYFGSKFRIFRSNHYSSLILNPGKIENMVCE